MPVIKKKILIFIDWYLPGFKSGGPIQSISNLILNLNKEFDFSVVTRDTDYCEQLPYESIISDEWNYLNDGTRVFYFSSNALSRKNILQLIKNENADIVYLNGIYSKYFSLIPLFYFRKNRSLKVIVAARGMLSEGSMGVKPIKKRLFFWIAKTFGLYNRVVFHATSKIEESEIKKVFGDMVIIKIASNLTLKIQKNLNKEINKIEEQINLVSIARIAPEKNLFFALKILSHIKCSVKFTIFGPVYNTDYWLRCQNLIAQMPKNITIVYNGILDNTAVADELKKHHFLFMPTTGENFGHIIFQSLSSGTPVIISDKTPWNDLEEKKCGWDISLNNQEKFIEVINHCNLISKVEYNLMSERAFEIANQYASNSMLISENLQLFENI